MELSKGDDLGVCWAVCYACVMVNPNPEVVWEGSLYSSDER